MSRKRNTKRGSLIVEASIILPIFIIAVCTIISIIPIIGTCEKAVFSAADEIHLIDAEAAIEPIQLSFPIVLKNRIDNGNGNIRDVEINQYRYKFRGKASDDLISATTEIDFEAKNPLGLFSNVKFSISILSRGFTGSNRTNPPMSRGELERDEPSMPVYIFPNWGKRYHSYDCTYVRDRYKMEGWYYIKIEKNDAIDKGYTPCLKCGGD